MKALLAALLIALGAAGAARAAPLLPGETAPAADTTGRIDFMTGRAGEQTTRVWGFLALPPGEARVPAMVIMHGSTGLVRSRQRHYELIVPAAGIATFHVDSFAPRFIASTVPDQSLLPFGVNVFDAFNALRMLQHHPRIDPERIGVMGFSRGGAIAWMTAMRDWFRDYRRMGLSFALHVPFYPGCAFAPDLATTDAPMLFLLGAADDWVAARQCEAFAAQLQRTNPRVASRTYPEARHGWEGMGRDGAVTGFADVQNFTRCPAVLVRADGGGIDLDSGVALDRDALRTLRAGCLRASTVTAGANSAIRAESDRDLLDFLRREFRLGQ